MQRPKSCQGQCAVWENQTSPTSISGKRVPVFVLVCASVQCASVRPPAGTFIVYRFGAADFFESPFRPKDNAERAFAGLCAVQGFDRVQKNLNKTTLTADRLDTGANWRVLAGHTRHLARGPDDHTRPTRARHLLVGRPSRARERERGANSRPLSGHAPEAPSRARRRSPDLAFP